VSPFLKKISPTNATHLLPLLLKFLPELEHVPNHLGLKWNLATKLITAYRMLKKANFFSMDQT
jgi:hypothetical protein